MNIETVISIISVVVASTSAIFAWKAVKTSERTYKAKIIAQIYEKYQSPNIRKNLQTVWEIYRQAWRETCKDDAEAAMYTNKGEPISMEMARNVLRKFDKQSDEYMAIDNVKGLWTYIMMLVFQGILDIDQLSAFATPRSLGFLYPLDEAKASLYGYNIHPKTSLKNLYEMWKKKYPESF
jgi:hypothetical protein